MQLQDFKILHSTLERADNGQFIEERTCAVEISSTGKVIIRGSEGEEEFQLRERDQASILQGQPVIFYILDRMIQLREVHRFYRK